MGDRKALAAGHERRIDTGRARGEAALTRRPGPSRQDGVAEVLACMQMKRVMFQADEELIERAKRRAADRGVSFAQVVRESLEREVGSPRRGARPTLTFIGRHASGRRADAREDTERGPVPPVSSPASEPSQGSEPASRR